MLIIGTPYYFLIYATKTELRDYAAAVISLKNIRVFINREMANLKDAAAAISC
jgi:hypothetical protein